MKRKIRSIFAAALSVMVLAGCGNKAPEPQVSPAATEYKWEFAMKNTGIDELKTECDQKGSVVSLEYDTPAYAVNDLLGLNETIHKKMSVYLPYNYDESQTYNVLYLLHGTEGDGMRSRIPKDKEPIRKKCHRKRNGPSGGRKYNSQK